MKSHKDNDNRIDENLDQELLQEHATLLLAEALRLAKGIPADGGVESANQSKQANQRENN